MGIFDVFKKKPETCAMCAALSPGLHGYNAAYFKDESGEPGLRLCTSCLFLKFGEALQNFSGRCVFIEPLTADGYVFLRFADDKFQANVAQPLATYVAERHACRNCAKDARFAWLPLEVTDDSDHRRGAPLKYKPASGFSGGEQFCAEHMTQRLKELVEEKRLYFTTIRPPVGSLDGYLN